MAKLKRDKDKLFLKDYVKDRKTYIILFFLTISIFTITCSLYHMENLIKLLYAGLLCFFIWVCFGAFDYIKYYRTRTNLNLAIKNSEVIKEVILYSENKASVSELESAYEEIIGILNEEMHHIQEETVLCSSERNDYYLMWAHQIKTPIAAMKLLLNDREDKYPLLEELFKIEQYVEMVLHYLRLESMSSDMVLKEYELYQLVKQAVKKHSILFINSGLSLQLSEFDTLVVTDEKWFSLVLDQVLSNALKYTRSGSISIYMEGTALVIEDTGIGIRQEDLPRVFERGFTGYNGRMDKKSTGIGLYISKQVVDKLAHSIIIKSEEGKGTKVYIDVFRETIHSM